MRTSDEDSCLVPLPTEGAPVKTISMEEGLACKIPPFNYRRKA